MVDSRTVEALWLGAAQDDLTPTTLKAGLEEAQARAAVYWDALREVALHAPELHVSADAMEFLREHGFKATGGWEGGEEEHDGEAGWRAATATADASASQDEGGWSWE